MLWEKAVHPENICPQDTMINSVQHKSMAAFERAQGLACMGHSQYRNLCNVISKTNASVVSCLSLQQLLLLVVFLRKKSILSENLRFMQEIS